MRWFLDRGCEAVKVCADPGDLVLWDSRTVHYNCLPESEAVRSVLCKCIFMFNVYIYSFTRPPCNTPRAWLA